jgi:spermidine synthase
MVGLGGGSISTYLGRAMPQVQIDVVELDPGPQQLAHRAPPFFSTPASTRYS